MRVLLDENVPVDLARELVGHEVAAVQALGWSGRKNGEILQLARGQCDAFVTMDSNLEYQQQLTDVPFGVVVLRARSNRIVHLKPLVPAILEALSILQPGEVRRVGG